MKRVESMSGSDKKKSAISPTREEDYSEWYQQVIKAADMAENSPVRGCMVIKPWGFSIWELIQSSLDKWIKETGHQNVYFPLFIPLSFLEKEASHVVGFAKECAVVTHHRLEERGGKLIPTAPLDEPLVIRPTSEAIIGDAFSNWIHSWRDLPLLINQWANIVRWEMRPRIFLRTAEFLWQEGHSAHATEEEARAETLQNLDTYRRLAQDVLAIPVITGEKSPGERFPGADNTYTIETMTQDRKALQGGTSHYLGQNFAKAFGIKFNTKQETLEYAYTSSFGATTRLIGALIMTHADDDGLRLPPRVAPYQVVIIPILTKPEKNEEVLQYAKELQARLKKIQSHDLPVRVHVDMRDLRGGDKNWDWIKKGVPLRIEVGPRDIEAKACTYARRDKSHQEKSTLSFDQLEEKIPQILDEIQKQYFAEALSFRKTHIYTNIKTFEELRAFFTPKNIEKPEIHGGFVLAKWCGDPASEKMLDELKISIRCVPLEQSGTQGTCILTGKPAVLDAIFAKSY